MRGMELEELMTNRVLLEKMSSPETNHHHNHTNTTPYRKHNAHHTTPSKHVIIHENHNGHNNNTLMKPKEIRIEYKNSHNSIYTTTTTTEHSITPPPPPLVLEGYGCKCPHKLKKVMKILWVVLIFLYIFGMPIILVHMHNKLTESDDRLASLETRFNKHLGIEPLTSSDSSSSEGGKTSKYTHGEEGGDNNEVKGDDVLRRENYRDLQVQLENIKKMVNEHKTRISFIENFQVWMNGTENGTNSKGQRCFCFSNLADRAKQLLKGLATTQPKTNASDKCECSKVTIGLPGPPGPQGPMGLPGKDAVFDIKVLEKYRGIIGKQGEAGTQGNTGTAGVTGQPGRQQQTQSEKKEQRISTTYTHWGKSSCESTNPNASTVYKGYVAGSYHTQDGGGSNYLCLPEQPTYGKYDAAFNQGNRAFIYGVEFELGDSSVFEQAESPGHFNAFCSVCKVEERSNTIMVPATTQCPTGWNREYGGFLMAQKRYLKRTEYICVDSAPDLNKRTARWDKGGFLHFVETRCGALPCRSDGYVEYRELPCTVCSS